MFLFSIPSLPVYFWVGLGTEHTTGALENFELRISNWEKIGLLVSGIYGLLLTGRSYGAVFFVVMHLLQTGRS
ncbi:MAG: hypothetical protein JWO06_423 [Bacteroidota bacterium]|nr:hypothetical protein [Bacteroidota bacterium]